jgi:hypothetical protein
VLVDGMIDVMIDVLVDGRVCVSPAVGSDFGSPAELPESWQRNPDEWQPHEATVESVR